MTIALATCEQPPVPDEDAKLLIPALAEGGVKAELVAWSDPAADWAGYDRVWISSTWDYHDRRDEFVAWLRRAGGLTKLDNPADLVEWNLDKAYLRDLEAEGVPIVPTVWAGPNGGDTLGAAEAAGEVTARGWEEIVVKPNIDIGAHNLVRVPADRVEGAIEQIGEPCLVQPFLETIEGEGELSLIHYLGKLSHAIRKVPAEGDFRVQENYGGRFTQVEASPEAVEIGRRAIGLAAERHPAGEAPLYGRVDLVSGKDESLAVGEVELIEPALYLHHADEGATSRFAELLASENS